MPSVAAGRPTARNAARDLAPWAMRTRWAATAVVNGRNRSGSASVANAGTAEAARRGGYVALRRRTAGSPVRPDEPDHSLADAADAADAPVGVRVAAAAAAGDQTGGSAAGPPAGAIDAEDHADGSSAARDPDAVAEAISGDDEADNERGSAATEVAVEVEGGTPPSVARKRSCIATVSGLVPGAGGGIPARSWVGSATVNVRRAGALARCRRWRRRTIDGRSAPMATRPANGVAVGRPTVAGDHVPVRGDRAGDEARGVGDGGPPAPVRRTTVADMDGRCTVALGLAVAPAATRRTNASDEAPPVEEPPAIDADERPALDATGIAALDAPAAPAVDAPLPIEEDAPVDERPAAGAAPAVDAPPSAAPPVEARPVPDIVGFVPDTGEPVAVGAPVGPTPELDAGPDPLRTGRPPTSAEVAGTSGSLDWLVAASAAAIVWRAAAGRAALRRARGGGQTLASTSAVVSPMADAPLAGVPPAAVRSLAAAPAGA